MPTPVPSPSYPPSSREAVMAALLTTLQTALQPATFVTISRKLQLWGDVQPEEQPALFITKHAEEYLATPIGTPPKRGWSILFWIYATIPNDQFTLGDTVLNNLIDALEAVITPKHGYPGLTFGNTVYRAWPEGLAHFEPGDLDGQAIAIVPYRIRPP